MAAQDRSPQSITNRISQPGCCPISRNASVPKEPTPPLIGHSGSDLACSHVDAAQRAVLHDDLIHTVVVQQIPVAGPSTESSRPSPSPQLLDEPGGSGRRLFRRPGACQVAMSAVENWNLTRSILYDMTPVSAGRPSSR
jgi:hypothetical protein